MLKPCSKRRYLTEEIILEIAKIKLTTLPNCKKPENPLVQMTDMLKERESLS